MKNREDILYDTKRKMLAKYPRFGGEIAASTISFRDDLPCPTAATDGKNIFIDPDYFESLKENDRLFLIAHEVMHIKFMHMYRLIDKNGNKRDLELWNIATDAIINANLERDGLNISDGYINMPEALNYTAEEFYDILLKKREQQNQEKSKKQNKDAEEKGEQGQDGEEMQQGDDHSLWEEAFESRKQQRAKGKKSEKEEDSEKEKQNDSNKQQQVEFDEKSEFEKNRQEKIEKFKVRRKQTEKNIRSSGVKPIKLGDIGESKENINWKQLLKRELEKDEPIWSQRRSIAENNYAYRLEENDMDDEAETEIMLDVSGSVELDLIKAFLRQIKPILRHSKVKVGCFSDEFFGMMEIKSEKDIENFILPPGAGGGTDLELAVKSFSTEKGLNKIVFTDGYGQVEDKKLRRENIIWLVYGNEEFTPCCGKVINITQEQIQQMNLTHKDISDKDMNR